MIGKLRASGFGLCALALAVACGNTANNGKAGQPPGTAGVSAVAGSGGNAGATSAGSSGTAGTAGSEVGGTASGGTATAGNGGSVSGEAGGTDIDSVAGAAGEAPVAPQDRIELVRDKVPNKLDLLMMIDNSRSMSDKQHLLADAMQHLVDRLVQPRCLDEQGAETGQSASAGGVCPLGSHPEFLPFNDIHAAVISSSLGSHGAAGTDDVCVNALDDDHAQLLGRLRSGLPSWNNTGFLAWDPKQQLNPPGLLDLNAFAEGLGKTVEAAGDHGCGFEASLEAWYRFLVDPEPPATVTLNGSTSAVASTSTEVLNQRDAFLRSDSVLGIVMLSDENDCSIVDSGYGWLVSHATPMFRASSACGTNPNDQCCQSCGEGVAHAGCPALADDVECKKGSYLAKADDDLNLRCYQQRRRFGFDLLYPIQRYVDALTLEQIPRRSDNALVPNPIYKSRNGATPRSPEQVLLLGIVGVPWQDVADAASLANPGLKLLSEAGQLPSERWAAILGDPSASPPVLPTDPFMVETADDRTALPIPQSNPFVPAEKLVSSASTDPQANHINGHEAVNLGNHDLQLACSFELPKEITCDYAAFNNDEACDCFQDDLVYNRALCNPAGGGAATISQRYGKAYPGLRELQVLKGVGGHGIVASTCAKTADKGSASYGYRPAMDALAGRVAKQIGRSCLNQDAAADASGHTACSVVTASSGPTCTCPAEQGLTTPSAEAKAAALQQLASVGYCGPGMACASLCVCGLAQLDGADLVACQTADVPPAAPGFCYLNNVQGEAHAGKPELAGDCVGAAPRRIRFTGGAPAQSSVALLYCPG